MCRSSWRGRSGSTPSTSTSTTTCVARHLPRPEASSSCDGSSAGSARSASTAPSRCGRSGWSRVSPTDAGRWSTRRTTAWSTACRAPSCWRCCSTSRPRRRATGRSTGVRTRLVERRHARRRPVAGDGHRRAVARRAQRAASAGTGDPRRRRRASAACGRSRAASRRKSDSGLTGPVGSHRVVAWAAAPLADVKAVRTTLGGTVNDVVLAAITNGFRELLLSRGESVDDRTVRTLIPVSVRGSRCGRRGERRRHLQQQGVDDVRSPAGGDRRPGRTPHLHSRPTGGAEEVEPGDRRRGADIDERIGARCLGVARGPGHRASTGPDRGRDRHDQRARTAAAALLTGAQDAAGLCLRPDRGAHAIRRHDLLLRRRGHVRRHRRPRRFARRRRAGSRHRRWPRRPRQDRHPATYPEDEVEGTRGERRTPPPCRNCWTASNRPSAVTMP